MKRPFEGFRRGNAQQASSSAGESAQTRGDRARANYEERMRQEQAAQDQARAQAEQEQLVQAVLQAAFEEPQTPASAYFVGAATEAAAVVREHGYGNRQALEYAIGLLQDEANRAQTHNGKVMAARQEQAQAQNRKAMLLAALKEQPFSVVRGNEKPLPDRPQFEPETPWHARLSASLAHGAKVTAINVGRATRRVVKQGVLDVAAGSGLDSTFNDIQIAVDKQGKPKLRVINRLSSKAVIDYPLDMVGREIFVAPNPYGSRKGLDTFQGWQDILSSEPRERDAAFGELVVIDARHKDSAPTRVPVRLPQQRIKELGDIINALTAPSTDTLPLTARPNRADLFSPLGTELARQLNSDRNQ